MGMSKNSLGNGKHGQNLETTIQIKYERNNYSIGVSSKRKYMHSGMTPHMCQNDTSILTE
jgi:hypothetical protein